MHSLFSIEMFANQEKLTASIARPRWLMSSPWPPSFKPRPPRWSVGTSFCKASLQVLKPYLPPLRLAHKRGNDSQELLAAVGYIADIAQRKPSGRSGRRVRRGHPVGFEVERPMGRLLFGIGDSPLVAHSVNLHCRTKRQQPLHCSPCWHASAFLL